MLARLFSTIELLAPKGDIAAQERTLILLSLGIMLLVVVPVMVLTLVFAWRYRAGNAKATYAPNWAHSTGIEVVVWSIPCIIVGFLGLLIWRSTHTLDPYRPLDSATAPIEVEVVALDWKWLFIYPDYGIATVNQLAIPTDTPINFRLTSTAAMNAFFIPQLGSQIYAMAGMQTQLHLIARQPGLYAGRSTAFSGEGFSDMHFTTRAMPPDQFEAWVQEARDEPAVLDQTTYRALEKPSVKTPPITYSRVVPGLFDAIVDRFMADRLPALALNGPICSTRDLLAQRIQ
jgi:cytochrome o ubiquinol oxidase subunit II